MTGPMKIVAKMKGDVASIRVMANHPMESGLRKEADGKLVPAHHIQHMTVALNGKTMVAAQISGSIAKNPLFGYAVKGAKAGDKVSVTWVDNKGDKRTDEAVVTLA
ncbi:MAG: thiosulfate oxidation carrier complex protein SoxZ [Rhodocyclaceae bacterium]|nr:thiosulfate oxidation carrier complex protein SoxZ [Rhodocyclaceae bacterium]